MATTMIDGVKRDLRDGKEYEAPSDEFMRTICGFSTAIVECELCGTVHVAPDSDLDFDEKEMRELVDAADVDDGNPTQVHDGDGVSWGYLDGKQVVDGCYCHGARLWEDWIVGNQGLVMDFLCRRAERKVAEAKEALALAGKKHDIDAKEDEAARLMKRAKEDAKRKDTDTIRRPTARFA